MVPTDILEKLPSGHYVSLDYYNGKKAILWAWTEPGENYTHLSWFDMVTGEKLGDL